MILFPCQRVSAVPIFFVVFRKKLSQQREGSHVLVWHDHPTLLPRMSDMSSGELREDMYWLTDGNSVA